MICVGVQHAAPLHSHAAPTRATRCTEVTADDDGPDLGETDNTDFAVQGGVGLNFGPGLFVEGKFVNVFGDGDNRQLIPISVGIRF